MISRAHPTINKEGLMKKGIALLCLMLLLIPTVSVASAPETPMYTVTFGLSYVENTLVNTYDLSCTLDGVELFTLEQGQQKVFSLQLTPGSHTLAVVGQNKGKSSDAVDLDISADVAFSIACKAQWTGLKITRCDMATGEESIQMVSTADWLGAIEDSHLVEKITQVVDSLLPATN